MKRFAEVKFSLAGHSHVDDRLRQLEYALIAFVREIEALGSEGYKVSPDWIPPSFTIVLEDDLEKTQVKELKMRVKNLQNEIRRKNRTED